MSKNDTAQVNAGAVEERGTVMKNRGAKSKPDPPREEEGHRK